MNAQQLKNAILQEAIEGRLVAQDPAEEPARELLKRIRKEKERLVKEGKLKKKDLEEKPITEEEIPFEIPESWVWVRLSTLSSAIHYGFTASAAPAGNAKLLRITDIQNDKVDWRSVPFCTTKEKDLDTYQLKNRDILIARTGGTIGKTYIVRQLDEVAVFASYLIRVIPLEEVNEEFLKLFMMTPCYWKQLTDASSGTGQPNVNGQSLSNLILPIPPKEEQNRILSKYEELLPMVEEYRVAQEALDRLNGELGEKLKKSVLQEAIEGHLVAQDPAEEPARELLKRIRKEKERLVKEGKLKKKDLEEKPITEEEIPFEIPAGWEWVHAKDCCTIIFSGKTPSYSKIPNNHLIIGQQANQWNGLDLNYVKYGTDDYVKNIDEYQYLNDGDVLLNSLGNGTLGRCGIFESIKDKILTDGHLFVFRTIDKVTSKYILYYLTLNYTSINKSADGSTNQTFLNLNKVSNYIIPFPPLAEQYRIVEKLDQVLGEIDKLKA